MVKRIQFKLCLLLLASGQLLLCSNILVGQEGSSSGAESLALASSNLCLINEWSANNNPAALSKLENNSLAFAYRSDFFMAELSSRSAAFNYKLNKSGFGLILDQFGFKNYNEQSLGLSYGLALSDNFSAGVQLLYQRLELTEPYGSSSSLTAKAGFLAKLSERIHLAALLVNPNGAKKANGERDIYPQIFKIGLQYQQMEALSIHFQLDKELEKPISPSLGINYKYSEIFYLRAGVRRNLDQYAFGFSYRWENFQFDLASRFNYVMGFSPAISIVYQFDQK